MTKPKGWRAVHARAIAKIEADGCSQEAFYEGAGISETTFRKMAEGAPLKRKDKIRSFERWMCWGPGSAAAVAAGLEPDVVEPEAVSQPSSTDVAARLGSVDDRLARIEDALQELLRRAVEVVDLLEPDDGAQSSTAGDESPGRDRQAPSTPNH